MKDLYQDKETHYFSTIRKDIIRLLPHNPSQKILEIGAAKGDTLVYIKQNKLAQEVVGVDIFEMSGTNQSNSQIDAFHIANIESDGLEYLKQNYFDVIICGDVLEHLLDPWAAVNKLSQFLKKGGVFIASLPNIRHRSAIKKIFLKGDFGYTSEGLFDKTHFRFFCKKNSIALFNTNDLKVEKCLPIFFYNKWSIPAKLINTIPFKIFEEFISMQFLISASKR